MSESEAGETDAPTPDELADMEDVDAEQSVQPINAGQFDRQVRELIDLAIQSGVSQDTVEDALARYEHGVSTTKTSPDTTCNPRMSKTSRSDG